MKDVTPSFPTPLCNTSSKLQLLEFLESTSSSLLPPFWTFFVIFFLYYTSFTSPVDVDISPYTYFHFLSPVDAVNSDPDFHITDQGRVVYLYQLQLFWFNLQDALSLSSNNLSSSSTLLLLNMRHYKNNNTMESCTVTSTFLIGNSKKMMLEGDI